MSNSQLPASSQLPKRTPWTHWGGLPFGVGVLGFGLWVVLSASGCAKAVAASAPAGPPLQVPAPPERVLAPVEEPAVATSAPVPETPPAAVTPPRPTRPTVEARPAPAPPAAAAPAPAPAPPPAAASRESAGPFSGQRRHRAQRPRSSRPRRARHQSGRLQPLERGREVAVRAIEALQHPGGAGAPRAKPHLCGHACRQGRDACG